MAHMPAQNLSAELLRIGLPQREEKLRFQLRVRLCGIIYLNSSA